MSIASLEQSDDLRDQQTRRIELPNSVHSKLELVIHQNRKAELLRLYSVLATSALIVISSLVAIDLLLGLTWTPIRWVVWAAVLGSAIIVIVQCVVRTRRENERLLDAAWKIEAAHPEIEERLATTVQFLSEQSRQVTVSPRLIGELVNETCEGVSTVDADSIPRRSYVMPLALALGGLACFVTAGLIWPQFLLTSLDNIATPWSAYTHPRLEVNITPGNATVAEGDSVEIRADGNDGFVDPVLEIIQDDILETHQLVATAGAVVLTLNEVTEDFDYRIRDGKLYSNLHSITVRPRPQLIAVRGHLNFPSYSQLDSVDFDALGERIEVPSGTEVTLVAVSDSVGIDAVIRWDDQSELSGVIADSDLIDETVKFEWGIEVNPGTDLNGFIEVQSEYGVRSESFPIKITALEDAAPSVEITAPQLRQLAMQRDAELPLSYQASDDFGISNTELMVQYDESEPLSQMVNQPTGEAGVPRKVDGIESVRLGRTPEDCQKVSLWLRVSDNRPEEFGGPQVVDSELIHITFDEDATSAGEQQIQADQKEIETTLGEAMDRLQKASDAADSLLNDARGQVANEEDGDSPEGPEPLDATSEDTQERSANRERANAAPQAVQSNLSAMREIKPNVAREQIETLRTQTKEAKQTLDRLAKNLAEESKLFQPKAEAIQKIADEEVADALELASKVPLVDERQERENLLQDTKQSLSTAIDELEQIKLEIGEQGRAMKEAARLDELASKQEQLANQAAKKDQKNAPDKDWRERQERVAEDLDSLANKGQKTSRDRSQKETDGADEPRDLDPAELKRLLNQADKAEELAQQANELAQEQERLQEALDRATHGDGQREEAKQQLKELISEQKKQQKAREAAQDSNKQPKSEEKESATTDQQRLEEASRAAEEGRLGKAVTELQEQLADKATKIQQQVERLSQEAQPSSQAQQQAQQAAKQMSEANRQAEKAGKSLREKAADAQSRRSEDDSQPQASKQTQQSAQQAEQLSSKKEQQGMKQDAGKNADQENASKRNTQERNEPKKRSDPRETDRKTAQKEQQKAAQALRQAAESLNQVCKSCRECANCNKPGSSGGSPGKSSGSKSGSGSEGQNPGEKSKEGKGSEGKNSAGRDAQSRDGSEEANASESTDTGSKDGQSKQRPANDRKAATGKQVDGKNGKEQPGDSEKSGAIAERGRLAKASKGAKQAAQSPSNQQASQKAQEVAKQVKQLADQAAKDSGYSLGRQRDRSKETQANQENGNNPWTPNSQRGQPVNGPNGVGKEPGDTKLNGQKLRGGSSSNWTRSQRKLRGGILEDRSGNVPEEYREVVERYFEKLSRQQSNSKEQ